MNSMDQIKQIYKNSNLVLIGNFSLPWFPSGIGDNNDLIKLKSKISPRLYLGINKIKNVEVIFNDVYFYLNDEKGYEKIKFSIVNKEYEKIKKEIINFLKNNNLDFGLEFNIYSEIPRGHGLGFSGVLSALISSGLYYLSSKINKDFFEFESIVKKDNFKEIYNFAYKLEKISKYNNTNGENSFFPFIKSKNPVLFVREDDKYEFFDLFNNEKIVYPFDYYIIFSGIKSDTEMIEYYLCKDKGKIDNLFSDLDIIKKGGVFKKKFRDYLRKNHNYNLFVKVFKFLNLKLLKTFEKIYRDTYSQKYIDDFIDIINEHRELIAMVEGKSEFVEVFLNILIKKGFIKNIGITPIYSGRMGGGYLLVTSKGTIRGFIDNILSDIKKFFPKAYIEYSSYEDEDLINGIEISQDIDEGIYNNYIKGEKFILETKNKKIIVSNLEEALGKDFDLLFDLVKQKVYLKGKKLTSKQIHSQNILVEIVAKTFNNQGAWFSNNILNKSSYSETKSLMGSKVVYPFKNLIKEEFGKDIEFEISGIGGNFKMKLDFGSLKVGIFNKI